MKDGGKYVGDCDGVVEGFSIVTTVLGREAGTVDGLNDFRKNGGRPENKVGDTEGSTEGTSHNDSSSVNWSP
jgi:hypothetical protein